MTDNNKAVYTVEEIHQQLGLGLRQTYDFLKEQRFPVKKIGKKLLIPKQGFDYWLTQNNENMYNMRDIF